MDFGKQDKSATISIFKQFIKLPIHQNHQSRGTYRQWHFFMEEIRNILSLLRKKQQFYIELMKQYYTKSHFDYEKAQASQIKYIKEEQSCFQNLKRYKKQNFYDAKSFVMKMFLRCNEIFQYGYCRLQQIGLQNLDDAYDNSKQQINNIYCKSLASRKHSCFQLLEKMAKTQTDRCREIIHKLSKIRHSQSEDKTRELSNYNNFKGQSRFVKEFNQNEKIIISNSFLQKLKNFRQRQRRLPKTVVICKSKPILNRCDTTEKLKTIHLQSTAQQSQSLDKKKKYTIQKPVIQNKINNNSIIQLERKNQNKLKLKKIGTSTHTSLNMSTIDISMNYQRQPFQQGNFNELFNMLNIQQIKIKQIQNNWRKYERDLIKRNKNNLQAYQVWYNDFTQKVNNHNFICKF